MKPKRIALTLVLIWALTFAVSFIVPRLMEATGDGFARGLNRVGIWIAWQFVALAIAIASTFIAFVRLKQEKFWRRIALIPICVQLLLILSIAGIIAYSLISKPSPTSEPTLPTTHAPTTSTEPAIPLTEVENYAGFYKRGFETSHFYSADGGKLYWIEADSDVWETIQSYRVERPGRGSSVTVGIDFDARLETNTSDLDYLGNFEGKLHIVSINSIRPLPTEDFEKVATSFKR